MSQQPLYAQVAAYVRERIDTGVYREGSRIPPENELAKLLCVSRPTVRQALSALAREGYLVRVKGSGTFAALPKVVHQSTTFLTGYREESAKHHRILRTQVLYLGLERAGEAVAQALSLRTGERVTRLTRLRHLENLYGNAPVVHTTVYVPTVLFPGMSQLDFTNISFYDALSARNLTVCHASRRLEVMLPKADIASLLEISMYEPVVCITSTGYTRAMVPVEYCISYYPASRSSFLIETHPEE